MDFYEQAEKELRKKIKLAYQRIANIDVPPEQIVVIELVFNEMDDVFGVEDRKEMLTK